MTAPVSLTFHIKAAILISVISLLIYSNTLYNGFVYDDDITIVNNVMIKSLSNLSELVSTDYFIKSGEISYRPVVTLTYFLDYSLYGLKPYGYHLTNIILHALNVVLLYFFLSLFFAANTTERAPNEVSNLQDSSESISPESLKGIGDLLYPPFLITLIFATHPVLTEAVNAISFREDLLAFMFYMLSFMSYMFLRKGSGSAFLYPASCVFFIFALLSKEMAVTLPLLIYGYEWMYGTESMAGKRKTLTVLKNPYIAGYLVITIVYTYLRFHQLGHHGELALIDWTFSERLVTLPWLVLSYIIRLIIPVNLSADYMTVPISSVASNNFIFSAAGLVIISCFLLSLRNREINFGGLFLYLTLLPVYNLFPIINPFAERYLYLPAVGFAIAKVGYLHVSSSNRKLLVLMILVVILSMHSSSIIQRNVVWGSSHSLWSDTLKTSPDKGRVRINLAGAFLEKGMFDEAERGYRAAIQTGAEREEAYNGLGNVYYQRGDVEKAIQAYSSALRLNPDYSKAHNNLGNVYKRAGHIQDAEMQYREALKDNPHYPEAHFNLGNIYYAAGRIEEAVREYQAAIDGNPGYAEAYFNLGNALQSMGNTEDAVRYYKSALLSDPQMPDAYFNLGAAYYSQGMFDEAEREFRSAVMIKPDYAAVVKMVSGSGTGLKRNH